MEMILVAGDNKQHGTFFKWENNKSDTNNDNVKRQELLKRIISFLLIVFGALKKMAAGHTPQITLIYNCLHRSYGFLIVTYECAA